MKIIIFFIFILLGINSYSQNVEADSIRANQLEVEIKELRKEAGAIFITSSLAHFNGLIGLINPPKDPDTMGPLILFGSIGLTLDIVAVIKLCRIQKKKKEFKYIGK